MVSICKFTGSIIHPFIFPPLLKFSFSPPKIRGNMKQKVYKKESRVSTQIRESGLFPCDFFEGSIWGVVTHSVMEISREDSKC